MPTRANMCHYTPTWANIAVCQLCRERQPLWNSYDGLKCLDQCLFVPMSQARPKAGAKECVVRLNLSKSDP